MRALTGPQARRGARRKFGRPRKLTPDHRLRRAKRNGENARYCCRSAGAGDGVGRGARIGELQRLERIDQTGAEFVITLA